MMMVVAAIGEPKEAESGDFSHLPSSTPYPPNKDHNVFHHKWRRVVLIIIVTPSNLDLRDVASKFAHR